MNRKKTIFLVGDDHPDPISNSDMHSRGVNFILSSSLLKKDMILILEFLCRDKGHQQIIDNYFLPNSSLDSQKSLENMLYGKNSLRGFVNCKNISFFALLRRAKEFGTRVLCGDSENALNKKNSFGANEERHKSFNEGIMEIMQTLISSEDLASEYLILCGDSHLFNRGNSLSLPVLIAKIFPDAELKVFVQQGQSFLDILDLDSAVIESVEVNYVYLPKSMPQEITDEEYIYESNDFKFSKIENIDKISASAASGSSGKDSFTLKSVGGEIPHAILETLSFLTTNKNEFKEIQKNSNPMKSELSHLPHLEIINLSENETRLREKAINKKGIHGKINPKFPIFRRRIDATFGLKERKEIIEEDLKFIFSKFEEYINY